MTPLASHKWRPETQTGNKMLERKYYWQPWTDMGWSSLR